jgi:hypothetical protein
MLHSPLISIHRCNLFVQSWKRSINVSVGIWFKILRWPKLALLLPSIHVPVTNAWHIQIDKNQMVRGHLSRENEVLFSTSYGLYIPWHILQHVDRRYRHDEDFSMTVYISKGSKFEKENYLNSICLSTWFLWAGIISSGIRGDSIRL